jgi:hypothetical protein
MMPSQIAGVWYIMREREYLNSFSDTAAYNTQTNPGVCSLYSNLLAKIARSSTRQQYNFHIKQTHSISRRPALQISLSLRRSCVRWGTARKIISMYVATLSSIEIYKGATLLVPLSDGIAKL